MELSARAADLVALGLCLAAIVVYGVFKRHKQSRHETWKEVVEARAVELCITVMYIALVAPEWGRWLTSLFGRA